MGFFYPSAKKNISYCPTLTADRFAVIESHLTAKLADRRAIQKSHFINI